MRRALAVLAAGLALAAGLPAAALDVPKAGVADPRIKTVDYDPGEVVRVVGAARTATQVVFAPEETIQHVALGDSAAWQVAADRNVLFLKPKAKRAPTDLIVTTDRGGAARSYVFELVVRRKPASSGAFVLRFRYPADEKARVVAALDSARAATERRVSELKLDRGALEGPRNLAYAVQGPADLQPSEISDNGRFTVLRFPGAQALPAIYTVSASGAEALAAFDVRGEFVIVHGVAPGLRLRRGSEVLCVFNTAWRPAGAPTGTLTAAPDVARTDQGTAR